jgi:hypothetical protein
MSIHGSRVTHLPKGGDALDQVRSKPDDPR